jgi:hypothetical protein
MARPKRKPATKTIVPRTVERIAIAALAAVATRGSGESIAFAAITIFVVVVIVEELSRRWVWHGKGVTLRDVALGTIGELRIWRDRNKARNKRKRRRSRARAGRSDPVIDQAHAVRVELQE